jgi:pyrimidine deaminase RibD-like protein
MKVIQILKESSPPDLMKGFEDFLPLAMSVLEIDKLPPIKIVKDVPGSQPSFGGFDQNSGIIYLQITNRHPLDIFRTLAHELVHFKQDTEHKLDDGSGETGSPIENEANATAGIVMRHFNKKYPHYLSHKPLIKEDTSDYEIHNYEKLDKILTMLCKMVIKGQKSNKDYGMVAACVLDPDNQMVAKLNYPTEDGLRVHAERAAMEAYQSKYGDIPEGSIIITTLSPCNELSDETADGRSGNNCTDLINNSPVRKVYCGYIDPSQGNEAHDERDFNLMETENGKIRELCKSFADTFLDEDYHPNDTPRGPEFKPTMPAGTVRVDVSDVYDWYKLGKNIANLKQAKASDFGKGPPSTIMAFGSEPEEHKYIDHLKKLGLTTTDIDPLDPKQPKKMPRQKVDPTYNVGENFADGKNPQDKGDSKRHGVPTKASVSTLRKVAKQGGRKGQLAHWMANMKAGKKK